MKRFISFAGAVLAVSAVSPAQAVPSIDKVGIATATLSLRGSDGATYAVDVLARMSEAGTSQSRGRVEVTVRRCVSSSCTKDTTYAARLPAPALTVANDLSSGKLSTSIFGFPLVLSLTAADDTTSTDGKAELYQPVLPTGQVRVWVKQERQAAGQSQMMAKTCKPVTSTLARDDIADGVELQLAASLPTSLPRAFAGLRNARCA